MPRGAFRINTLGLSVAVAAPPAEVVSTMTFIQSQTFTSTSFIFPSMIATGDICIINDSSATTTDVTPSGFTSITKAVLGTSFRQNVSYKIVTSGDATGININGLGGTSRKTVLVFRPDRAISSVTATVTGTQATSAVPTNQSLVGQAGPMIAFACYSASGASITTRGWSVGSPTEAGVAATGGSNYVKFLITNSGTPSTTTISQTDNGNNALQSFRLKFT
jgi:hypothetical protein